MNKIVENNDLIKNVKATFFDVLAEQIKELIEVLQKNNSSVDSIEKKQCEDKINQLIVLISNTMGNVQELNSNISNFEQVADNVEVEKSNVALIENKSQALSADSNVNITSVENNVQAPSVDNNVNSIPLTNSVQNPTVDSNTNVTPVTAEASTSVPGATIAASSSNLTAQTFEMNENNSVQSPANDVVSNSSFELPPIKPDSNNLVTQVQTANMNVSNVASVPNVQAATAPVSMSIKKESNDRVKAILVNVSQFNKLASSKNLQHSKLDFGAMNNINVNQTKIEELMRQAGELYKAGKTAEAQALYSQISLLNANAN